MNYNLKGDYDDIKKKKNDKGAFVNINEYNSNDWMQFEK